MKTTNFLIALIGLLSLQENAFSQKHDFGKINDVAHFDHVAVIKHHTINEILGIKEFLAPEERVFELLPGQVFKVPAERIQLDKIVIPTKGEDLEGQIKIFVRPYYGFRISLFLPSSRLKSHHSLFQV